MPDTDQEAEATAAPADKKAKKIKEPKAKVEKPQERFWCGSKAAREGAVYNRLQNLVFANPGLTRDEIVERSKADGFAAKNSKKFEENPGQFIGGYLTAGARKGFFTNTESTAASAVAVTAVEKKEAAPKASAVTETGKAVLEAIKTKLEDRFGAGEGIPVSELATTLGKTKTQLSRTIDKLGKEGYTEVDQVQDNNETVDYIYVQQKGVDFLSAPAAE